METTRALIKKLTENDFDFYFSLYGTEEVMRFISGKPYTRDKALERFNEVIAINLKEEKTGYFKVSLKETNKPVGVAKIVMTGDDEAEMGYVFSPEHWGKGFGGEISAGLVGYAKNIPEIKSLVAITDPENTASKKILLNCGFIMTEMCIMDGMPGEIYRLVL
jgi:ribosomal-protein-alanine N-acetyltransferase